MADRQVPFEGVQGDFVEDLGHEPHVFVDDDGLCARIEAELGECTIVSTGGLSSVITPLSDRIKNYDPWLTLHGLRVIHEKNHG